MEISKSLEDAALSAIEESEGEETLIAVLGTPFFLSRTGEGIMVHDTVIHEGQTYYIGTRTPGDDQHPSFIDPA